MMQIFSLSNQVKYDKLAFYLEKEMQ